VTAGDYIENVMHALHACDMHNAHSSKPALGAMHRNQCECHLKVIKLVSDCVHVLTRYLGLQVSTWPLHQLIKAICLVGHPVHQTKMHTYPAKG